MTFLSKNHWKMLLSTAKTVLYSLISQRGFSERELNNSICVLRRNVLGKCAKNSSVAAKQNEVGASQAYEVSSYDIVGTVHLHPFLVFSQLTSLAKREMMQEKKKHIC